jgi:predicted secreted protein
LKKILLSVLLIGLSVNVFATVKQPVQYLKPGEQTYMLKLPSNPSTGYRWFLVKYNHHVLTLKSHQYFRAKTKLIGGEGLSVWQFSVSPSAYQAPMLGKVTLVYARPWEIDQAKPQTFYFVTQQQG